MSKKYIKVIGFVVILICALLLVYNNRNGTVLQTLQIYDYYDLPGYESFNEIIKKSETLNKMENLYEKENNAKSFKYVEVYTTLLQYVGHYVNGKEFIYEYGYVADEQLSEFTNQKVLIDNNETEVTNVKGVLIGKEAFADLDFSIKEGKTFTEKDFEFPEKCINVILGNNYRDKYKTGDKFTMLYMGEAIEANIIGFLQKQTYIKAGKASLLIDSYIIMPSFNIIGGDADTSYKIRHYSHKTKGFMLIKENKDVDEAKKEFYDMLNEVDLKYFTEVLD